MPAPALMLLPKSHHRNGEANGRENSLLRTHTAPVFEHVECKMYRLHVLPDDGFTVSESKAHERRSNFEKTGSCATIGDIPSLLESNFPALSSPSPVYRTTLQSIQAKLAYKMFHLRSTCQAMKINKYPLIILKSVVP